MTRFLDGISVHSAGPILAIAICISSGSMESVSAQPVGPGNSSPQTVNDVRGKRELAILKLLDGQRQMWRSQRLQTQAGKANAMKLAKAAFEEAVAIDPNLAEAYTALSEIAVSLPPGNLEEGLRLASRAVEIDGNNFGARRMLARLYTVKSRIGTASPDKQFADRAAAEWREVTRLDPRNAEGWAFIAAFAEAAGRKSENIEALRKWLSSSSALDVQFYGRIMNGGSLGPEGASLKLASALAAQGERAEAVRLLSGLLADDADNADAVRLLGEMIDSAEGDAAEAAVSALQQAVYGDAGNVGLAIMLARLQFRLGRENDAVGTLRRQSSVVSQKDKLSAAMLNVSLAELLLDQDRYDEAADELGKALVLRGIGNSSTSGESSEFASYVFERLIHIYKLSERPRSARSVIERARAVLPKDSPFPDMQLVSLLQSEGKRIEALALVRSLRARRPADVGLLRSEASLLTSIGQIDAAVALIDKGQVAPRTDPKPPQPNADNVTIQLPPSDRFSDLLFISGLYSRAGKYAEAAESARSALGIAAGSERRQIAKVSLASALHSGGDTKGAFATLEEVLTDMPNSPMALNNLAYFLIERGEQLDRAVDMVTRALKIDPRNPNYLDSLGWGYFKQGKLDLAEKHLREAARLDTDSPTILEHLGHVMARKGDAPRARSYWTKALRLAVEPADSERIKKNLVK